MNENMKVKWFDEEIEVYDEKRVVNKSTSTITLNYVPSKTRPLTVENKGVMLTEAEGMPSENQFVADRDNGLLLFNPAMNGKVMIINYAAVGQWCIGAEKVYTNVDNQGNAIETLEELISENREVIESIKTVGDAAKVVQQMQGAIDSITGLESNIIEGADVNNRLIVNTNKAKESDSNLNNTISTATSKINEMNIWVDKHGDIVDLDDRLDILNESYINFYTLTKERFLYVELFGAVGDYNSDTGLGTDNTAAIQKAIDYAYDNKISNIMFGSNGYVITGQLTIKPGITLIGTRESFTQTISTNTDNGANRYRLITESTLVIKPTNINITPLIFDNQNGIKNITIVYDQNFAANYESEIIKYAVTIKANHGFSCNNVCFKGAYALMDVVGESAKISEIYGWSFGTAIRLTNSDDVSFVKDIHLNPNVTRPTVSCVSLSRYRKDSISLEMIDCDGVFVDNYFAIGYRTGIKERGNPNVGTSLSNINNIFFDWIGLAFDFDLDTNFAHNITNATIIYGFTDVPSYGGLIKLNKSETNDFMQQINLNNICCSKLETHFVDGVEKVDNLITFEHKYGFELSINNLSYDKICPIMNDHGCKVTGVVNGGGYFIDLSTKRRNILSNHELINFTGDYPTGFVKSVPDEFTNVTAWVDDDGYCNVSNTDNLSAWNGLSTRKTIADKSDFCVYFKFKKWNKGKTKAFLKWWDKDYTNPREATIDVDDNGVVMYRTDSGNIIDISLCPSVGVSGNCIIDFIKLTRWNF